MTTEERTSPVVVGVARRYQQAALSYAVAEANRRRVKLRVVHAVWLPVGHETDSKGEGTRAAGTMVLEAARQFVEQTPAPPPAEYVLSVRPPVTTLMDEADSAICVVLGTDRAPWLDRLIGGDVSSWLARHAGCPVIVVPETKHDARASGDVVVAVDVDTVSLKALDQAFDQAELRRCRLRVLHAGAPELARAQTDHAHEVLERLLAQVGAAHPDVRIITNIVNNEADEACLQASQRADLLVLGRPRGLGWGSLLSRPVALRVLRKAQCPVLVAPDGLLAPGAPGRVLTN